MEEKPWDPFDNPKQWISFAEEDLIDSKSLSGEGRNRNALFLLQQSSEKLTKSIMMLCFLIIDEDEIEIPVEFKKDLLTTRRLSHQPARRLIQHFRDKTEKIKETPFLKYLSQMGEPFKSFIDRINPQLFDDWARTSKELSELNTEIARNEIEPILNEKLLSSAINMTDSIEKAIGIILSPERYAVLLDLFSKDYEVDHSMPVASVTRLLKYFAILLLILVPSMQLSSLLEFAVSERYPTDTAPRNHRWILNNYEAMVFEISGGITFCKMMCKDIEEDPYHLNAMNFVFDVYNLLVGGNHVGN